MDVTNRKREQGLLATISIGFLIWSSIFIYRSSSIAIDGKRYFCLFDDAMISMRYASNLSNGLGLVWNAGERVEGYTNLLMTLLMSVATSIFSKSNAALLMQIVGCGFMLTIALISMRIADHMARDRSEQERTFFRVLTFGCTLAYYPLSYWSLMGMETGLLTLLVLWAVLSAFDYLKDREPVSLLFLTISLGLAFLTRNDSLIFAILIWSYMIWERAEFRTNPKSLFHLLAVICLYVLFMAGQVVFRVLYYGEWVPNTYTLKLSGMPLLARLGNGIGFIWPLLLEIIIILLFSSFDLIKNGSKRKLLFLGIFLSTLSYQVYIGGEPWNYWRILSPAMPLLMILFIGGVDTVVHAQSDTNTTLCSLGHFRLIKNVSERTLILSLTFIGLLVANMGFLPEILFLSKPYSTQDNANNINTSLAIQQLTTKDASVGVYWAGAIPYFTDRKAIDFLGKSDKYISHLPPDLSGAIAADGMSSVPGHNKYDLYYSIITLRPTYVQGFVWGTQDLSQWLETKYVSVIYQGVRLFILKDSPAVLWDNLNVAAD